MFRVLRKKRTLLLVAVGLMTICFLSIEIFQQRLSGKCLLSDIANKALLVGGDLKLFVKFKHDMHVSLYHTVE